MQVPQFDLSSGLEEFEFDPHEVEVLKLLSSEQDAHYSFQGLRRRLGFHQETLTRTLKRLEEAHVIERSPEGYKLRGTGSDYSFTVQTHQVLAKPIVNAYLPSQVDVTVLFQRLRGKWFSNFRWLGYSRDGNQLSMSWISEDGHMELQARIGDGKITIGVESMTNQNETEQAASAYQLFDHITKVAEEMIHPETRRTAAN